jgi:hypothetical protein
VRSLRNISKWKQNLSSVALIHAEDALLDLVKDNSYMEVAIIDGKIALLVRDSPVFGVILRLVFDTLCSG